MSLFITSLSSGSAGNCYYVGNHTDAVLIDVGISCMEVEKRMGIRGLSIQTIRAIFVSHEHFDHVKGLSSFANKYRIPVYLSEKTAKSGPRLIRHLSSHFSPREEITISGLVVTPFSKFHDAVDPYSFTVGYKGITVGVFTDIGLVCPELIHHFQKCNAAFLESNYDEQMLESGSYCLKLKDRIRGGQGHLSNSQALELFTAHRPAAMTHLILSHLSQENNDPLLVQQLFAEKAINTQIIIAKQQEPTPVFAITVTN